MSDPDPNAKTETLNNIFHQLPLAAQVRLEQVLQARQFARGQVIYLQNAEPQAIYIVGRGRVKINRVTQNGYETILCIRGPGDIFCPVPVLDHGSQLGTATAITQVELFWAAKERFNQLCREYPQLLAMVQQDCLQEVRHLMERFETRAFLSVEERLARTLLEESRRCLRQGRCGSELRLKQEDLAGLIGCSRESVSRALGEFQKQGVLSTFRGRVALHDLEQLKRMCGGCDKD